MVGLDYLLGTLAVSVLLFGAYVVVLLRARRSGVSGVVRVLAGNLLLLGALLTGALAMAEVHYRWIRDKSDGMAIGLAAERWIERHYRYNALGIRDDLEYENRRTDDRPRITFIGDSYTNAHGVPNVQDRFVNLLRLAHPEWEVHFLGADGMDTGPLLGMLARHVREGYELDTVVYVYCENDISDLIPEWQEAANRLYSLKPPFPFDRSYFLNTWYYRTQTLEDPTLARYFDLIAEAYEGPLWDRQKLRLRRLADVVRGQGKRLLVVLFPFFETVDDARYRAIDRQLAAFWARIDVPYLSLTPVYAGLPVDALSANPRDTHPNERAHRMAADAIGPFIERELARDGSGEPTGRTPRTD